ncbi:MAG: alpha/beta fold hydrolase [Desulfobacteraceae bacterium]|jgi:esterase/lipase/1-acyl-sn-glycerol-3-phosphate acyltransferase|nr:alpha/beta fold hydrolase [Desulfobacteraceae bacterium]
MNRFAYRTTGFAIKTISNLSKANITLHGQENIPDGSIIFVINHFTRLETFLMPYQIFTVTQVPVWSLADYELFQGAFGNYLEKLGAVSTKSPDRDQLIVKTLLTGEANWIIFPEGRMVKNSKIIEKGQFMVSMSGGKHPPHTGAGTLAIRTEFYRQRMGHLATEKPDEARYLMDLFKLESLEPVLDRKTYIVPVNLTYYPIRARENILSKLALRLVDDLPERVIEELMTEGSMLLSGVQIDVRFGDPILISEYLQDQAIKRDIVTTRRINFDDQIASRSTMRRQALKLMQRYMTAIYSMTTVNLDHLFSSMLRFLRYKKFDKLDLCRRVFLVASQIQGNTGLFLNRSLQQDQVHLLTDDQYGKVDNFIKIAEEKGNLKKTNGTLIIDKSTFTSAYEFHRARIDNPIDVIANAVEPLPQLQRTLRRLATLPGFWIKKKVADHLISQAVEEYKKDYSRFFIKGESKPIDVGMPFLVKGKSKNVGVLLSHGYMAAPREVEKLARYLGSIGFWVYVPRLKGHGTSPDDLATRSYQDWMVSIDRGYAIISSICKRVVVGGFSTGAGLALDVATRVKEVAGVFAVAAPMTLKDFSSKFAPAVDMWNRIMDKAYGVGPKLAFVENKPENPHINYLRNPISGVREIERLMDDLEPKLPDLKVPSLIVQSRRDPVVDAKGSRKIFELLGTDDKEYRLFNFDRHGILLGEGSLRVHKAIGDFINRF